MYARIAVANMYLEPVLKASITKLGLSPILGLEPVDLYKVSGDITDLLTPHLSSSCHNSFNIPELEERPS